MNLTLIGRILVRVGAFLQLPAVAIALVDGDIRYTGLLAALGLLTLGIGYELEQGAVNAPGKTSPP